jgi:hypothetical protein
MDDYDEVYSSLCDCSCVVRLQVYDEVNPDTGVKTPAKKFAVIQNTPTLYFDSNNQAFCWRIGGQDTGLIAQGPKGESGQNATFYIVQLGEPTEPISDTPATIYSKKVTRYMNNNGGWVDLAPATTPSDFKDANCIAFEPTNIDGDETPTSYFGKIVEEGDSFVVSCTNDNRIQTNLNLNWLAASFASIGTNKALKGLFVPIEHPVPDSGETYNDKPVHAIWHASTKGHAQIFSELHISPMGTYAGINTAANELSTIGSTEEGRLDAYSKLIYSDASLVFDYKDVFFIGHHNNDSDDENGVRIGIGTNDIFRRGDSVGYHSLIRFSDNSKVDMPGQNSQANITNIYTEHISTPTGTDDVIDLACKTLNISGKGGKNVVVNIGGDIHLKNHLIFENNVVSDGISVNQIKIEEQSGIDRHLDIRTDGLYLSKRNYGEYNNTGDDAKSVHQYIDGHLDVLGRVYIKRGATINDSITIANNTQDDIVHQIKVELGSIILSSQYGVYNSSVKIGLDEINIKSPTTRIGEGWNGDLSVHGVAWLHTLLFSGVEGEEVPIVNTDTVGVEKYIRAKTGGTISGQSIKMGWQIDDLLDGTIIIVNGGNPSGWATPATDSDKNGNYVWCPDLKQYISISGGIYIVLTESGIKRLYCVSSHYHEQGYLK